MNRENRKKFIEQLISEMTVEEKIAQTTGISPVELTLTDEEKRAVLERGELIKESLKEKLKYGAGAFQLPGKDMSPKESAIYRNVLQKYVLKHTRLHIPIISQEECLNGQLAKGSTMFPRPIGMAGTFDRELVQEVYSAVGKETRARGGHQAFTPVLDIGRDPRWGRIEETFGEDTYLVTEMGKSVVSGLQGGTEGVTEDHIISSPKHFAGYAQGDGGRNFAPTNITPRVLRDQILPPFEAAVKECHAMGIMPSHAEIDGIPCHGNHWLLTDVLRGEWGFDGIVVSDYDDVLRLSILHGVAENPEKAAEMGLKAGVDMDVPQGSGFWHLEKAIQENPKLEKVLNQTVARILDVKCRLGLFENPYVDVDKIDDVVQCKEHQELAHKAARKTIILLKNEEKLLPLDKNKIQTIAVVGPTADPVEFSYYSARPNVGVSILDGIRRKTEGFCEVLYEQGCHIAKDVSVMETELDAVVKNPVEYTYEEEKDSIQRAVDVAQKSDIVIACLGGSPVSSREAVTLQKHYGDNASLDLTGQQNELLRQLIATGKPVVVVLINGKPLSCGQVYEHANAVLEGWYLGLKTGDAMADVLFGDYNPGAKLPVTITRGAGHLPGYYSQKKTGFLKDYLFAKEGPYYWFGYGLSYTDFEYSKLRVSKTRMTRSDVITVSVDVTNTGEREGEEVVQMYLSDPQASITRPERELKGFERVLILPKETVTVSFDIDSSMMEFTGPDFDKKAESGEFIIHVGKNCRDTLDVSIWLEEEC